MRVCECVCVCVRVYVCVRACVWFSVYMYLCVYVFVSVSVSVSLLHGHVHIILFKKRDMLSPPIDTYTDSSRITLSVINTAYLFLTSILVVFSRASLALLGSRDERYHVCMQVIIGKLATAPFSCFTGDQHGWTRPFLGSCSSPSRWVWLG